jgi:hypothetical protein
MYDSVLMAGGGKSGEQRQRQPTPLAGKVGGTYSPPSIDYSYSMQVVYTFPAIMEPEGAS